MKINSKEEFNKFKLNRKRGITLIALVITIVILLILATATIGIIFGNNGLITRGKEAKFKSRMSAISEELDLYIMNLSISDENIKIYAGEVLKDIVANEELGIDENNIQNIRNLIKSVGKIEEKYVMIYEGNLYYVSQSSIDNNDNQVKWCEDLGIRIWEYESEDITGIKVVNGNYELVNRNLFMYTTIKYGI